MLTFLVLRVDMFFVFIINRSVLNVVLFHLMVFIILKYEKKINDKYVMLTFDQYCMRV